MYHFTTTFTDPFENIAYDDALLKSDDVTPILRFWESPSYFVVLGHGNSIHTEVNLEACKKNDIPITRRCSGGGTVIQGPGCLNYALILPSTYEGCGSITSATQTIMQTHAKALSTKTIDVTVRGISDLCIGDKKISGNAQRRLKDKFLFHGTILYQFDLEKISDILTHPSLEPDYRKQRSHQEFVMNIPRSKEEIIRSLTQIWKSHLSHETRSLKHFEYLLRENRTKSWIYKF